MSTYVFDLDGTICTQEKFENYSKALPVENVIEKMRLLSSKGHTIVIHTARGMTTYGGDLGMIETHLRDLTETWLELWHVPYTELVFGKPSGDFYVDDKGINVRDFSFVK